MHPFPEPHELISWFSQEPALLDAAVPWCYNTLTFSGHRGDATYLVRLSPADGELELRIKHREKTAVHLSITQVAGITLCENQTEAVLMATFASDSPGGLLKFRLRPHLEIEWAFERR